MSAGIKSGVRVIADVEGGTILASAEVAAPPERVFRALTTGPEIVAWWGSPEHFRTTAWVGDLRPGGRWRADGVGADGSAFFVDGEYRAVDPPQKLVQTWKAAWDGGHEHTVTYRLDALAGGTRITLRHDGFADRPESCRAQAVAWEQVLGWLGRYVAPAEELRYFLCRLLPPRPTFAHDMSSEEAGVMRRHAAYWKGLLDQGFAVVFGPVGDPAGPWGLGVLCVPDEEKLRALRDADPVILADRGFWYETIPMLRAVVRS
jgi:uncharacterized protein YndB with AHSA1/START domain